MNVKIRFRKQPNEHREIIVIDSRRAATSRGWIEKIGYADFKTKSFNLHKDRFEYWNSVGAQMSDSVRRFLSRKEIVSKKPIPIQTKQHLSKKQVT